MRQAVAGPDVNMAPRRRWLRASHRRCDQELGADVGSGAVLGVAPPGVWVWAWAWERVWGGTGRGGAGGLGGRHGSVYGVGRAGEGRVG